MSVPVLRGARLAEEDLIDIWLRIAQDDPAAADRTLDAIDARARRLVDFPRLGPARDDIAPGLRYFPSGSHLILYRIVPGSIEIVRVVHGARDLFALTLSESP